MNEPLLFLLSLADKAESWLLSHLLSVSALSQGVTLFVCLMLGVVLAMPLRRHLKEHYPGDLEARRAVPRLVRTFMSLLPVLGAVVLLLAARAVFQAQGASAAGIKVAGDILLAFSLVRLAASVLLSRFWARALAVTALVAVALEGTGALSPLLSWLDGFGILFGGVRVTLVTVFKGGVLLALLVKAGAWASELAERRMEDVPDMTPSMRVLLAKIIRVSLFVLAGLVALGSVGIDLTALTVFSGAVGVGLGFGLQKVFGNLVSGFILLMDRSIKPGDVIEIGGVYGWIKELRARFVSVVTRDGREYLIPNEDLITGQVVNWSFSDKNVRIKLPVGVSYCTPDVRRVLRVMVDAAADIPRVLVSPAPTALFRGFGDSSLDLELRFWISDPQNGVANVSSAVGLAVLDALRAEGVEIPFPQRDVHLVGADSK